jgi:hypothetical protein
VSWVWRKNIIHWNLPKIELFIANNISWLIYCNFFITRQWNRANFWWFFWCFLRWRFFVMGSELDSIPPSSGLFRLMFDETMWI